MRKFVWLVTVSVLAGCTSTSERINGFSRLSCAEINQKIAEKRQIKLEAQEQITRGGLIRAYGSEQEESIKVSDIELYNATEDLRILTNLRAEDC